MKSPLPLKSWLPCILLTSTIFLVAGCGDKPSSSSANSVHPVTPVPISSNQAATSSHNATTWISDPASYEVTKSPSPDASISVPILEYHDADYVPGDIATLKPGQLDAQFAWLNGHNFHPINLGQLYAAFYYGYKLPSRPVVLTFDDGYESMYTKVFPLLNKYDFQATFFIVSGFTHSNPADNNKTFPTLTVAELKQLNQSPLVDIEDHTEHHRDLSKLSLSDQQQEIDGDASFLQTLTGHPIRYFCYPDGDYTAGTVQVVKQGGFLLATTQHQGYANLSQGPFALHRLTILDSTTLNQFASLLAPSLAAPSNTANISDAQKQQLYQAGATAFGNHDYETAIADESTVIAADASYYPAYSVKGIALCYAGHYDEGMTVMQAGLGLNPKYGYGLFNEALGLELYGHYDEAISTYQTAIPLGDGQWWKAWAYYGIASIYGRRGDVQHVAEYLKQAEALSMSTKISARTEKDFDAVRSSPVFQALLR